MKLKNVLFLTALTATIPFSANADAKLEETVRGTPLAGNADLSLFIGNFIKSIIAILGVILVALIVYGGITWMTAGGDAKKIDKAKDTLKAGIIGLIIAMTAYFIAYFVVQNLTNITK